MKLAEGIAKHGFRKWYERELLQSHAHLVLLILAVLGLMAAFEAAGRFHDAQWQLTNLVSVIFCIICGLWALRRYLALLSHAEAVANQADCERCKAYGRLDLISSNPEGTELTVRCRHCGHQWPMWS